MTSSGSYLALRRCLKTRIPESFAAADLLSEAVDGHFAGDRGRADRLIREADMPAIGQWVLPLLGTDKTYPDRTADIRFREVGGAPAILPKADRIPVRMPTAAQKAELIALYGYNCAFCGIPLVDVRVRKARGDRADPRPSGIAGPARGLTAAGAGPARGRVRFPVRWLPRRIGPISRARGRTAAQPRHPPQEFRE